MTAVRDSDVWLRRGCALVVASVAAYASYQHQRRFALSGGADPVGAALWPASVDGLMVLATVNLLADKAGTRRARWAARSAFGLGVLVSLAANIAAAPRLAWQPMLVAGWPPLALVLAVELLAHRRAPVGSEATAMSSAARAPVAGRGETIEGPPSAGVSAASIERSDDYDDQSIVALARPADDSGRNGRRTAEEVMWAHYEREKAAGRSPSGAELDRVAGTNNYGRSVLARWRRTGRLADGADGRLVRRTS